MITCCRQVTDDVICEVFQFFGFSQNQQRGSGMHEECVGWNGSSLHCPGLLRFFILFLRFLSKFSSLHTTSTFFQQIHDLLVPFASSFEDILGDAIFHAYNKFLHSSQSARICSPPDSCGWCKHSCNVCRLEAIIWSWLVRTPSAIVYSSFLQFQAANFSCQSYNNNNSNIYGAVYCGRRWRVISELIQGRVTLWQT